jgi:hypothetical protein
MKPEDEWGSPGGQEMFQELFTLLLYSLDGKKSNSLATPLSDR